MERKYDLVIIGGGPAGYTAALYGARAGLRTLVLEKLSAVSGTPVPAPLSGLKSQEVLHKSCVKKEEMAKFICKFL